MKCWVDGTFDSLVNDEQISGFREWLESIISGIGRLNTAHVDNKKFSLGWLTSDEHDEFLSDLEGHLPEGVSVALTFSFEEVDRSMTIYRGPHAVEMEIENNNSMILKLQKKNETLRRKLKQMDVAKSNFSELNGSNLSNSAFDSTSSDSQETLFEGVILDWRVQEGVDLPIEDRQPFEVRIARNQNQIFVDMAPPHKDPDEIEGKSQMSLFIEINEGLPCVHLSNACYNDQVLTVFASTDGLYLRPDSQDLRICHVDPRSQNEPFYSIHKRDGGQYNACGIRTGGS